MSDDQRRSRTTRAPLTGSHRVTVLGSFTLTARDGVGSHGGTVPLGVDARRLVAYLAVHPRPQERAALAADLWPGAAADAAARLLADAVAALDVPGLLTADGPTLSLAADVEVDLADAMGLVRAMPEIPVDDTPDVALLDADILPGWDRPVDRRGARAVPPAAPARRGGAQPAAVDRRDARRAVALAETAVRAAPSRESARRALIEAHLAQGNIAAAVAQYDDYRELLRSSVGGPDPSGLDGLLPPAPVWPVLRARRPMPRSAVQLPGLRSVRGAGGGRRLVAGGSVPGTTR
jgi:hypothetical protein